MADDATSAQIIGLLEEIRDLQKEHTENYKVALQNQQEAIALQKKAVQRGKTAFFGLIGVFLFVTLVIIGYLCLPVLFWLFSWMARR